MGAQRQGAAKGAFRGGLAHRDCHHLPAAALGRPHGLLQSILVVGVHDKIDGFIKTRLADNPEVDRRVGDMLHTHVDSHGCSFSTRISFDRPAGRPQRFGIPRSGETLSSDGFTFRVVQDIPGHPGGNALPEDLHFQLRPQPGQFQRQVGVADVHPDRVAVPGAAQAADDFPSPKDGLAAVDRQVPLRRRSKACTGAG